MYPVKIALCERGDGYSATVGEFMVNERVRDPTLGYRILL